MQFLLLGILLLLAFMYASKKYKQADPKDILYSMRWVFVGAVLLFVLFLVATGKAQLIWLAFLSFLPWIKRFFVAKTLYKNFTKNKSSEQGDNTQKQANPSDQGPMNRAEAFRLLGLNHGASDDDIRKAHREMMKKHHPDAGGDAEIAAKMNRAKDILLP